MANVEMSWRVDWRKFQPTRKKVSIALSIWAAIAALTTIAMYFLAATGRSDIVIGGDFLAFYTAAKGTVEGAAAEIYNAAFFQDLMGRLYPDRADVNLTWQYPPTYLLMLAPLALLPHLAGYAVWSTASAAGFAAVMRNIATDKLILFAILASPSAYAAYITGQNGFFTGALIVLAAVYPKTRPILAGVAAGLLTMKPHLGILIPVAYLAAGCWRSFFTAVATAAALALASLAVFGPEVWQAFLASLQSTSDLLGDGRLPVEKMATPYSAALYLGLPDIAAKFVYGLFAAASVAIVFLAWRRLEDTLLKASALIACVFMTAPYGYHYELIMLALPLGAIASIALKNGWLPYEKWLLAAAFLLPLAFSAASKNGPGLSYPFIAALIVFAITIRRIRHAAPGVFAFNAKQAA